MVHLVVSCTKRKRTEAVERLSDILICPPVARAGRWLARLRDSKGPTVPAAELYSGDHWSVVRTLAARPTVRVWVCSAGYGLVDFNTRLVPYSATFASGEADSVTVGPTSARTLWWQTLATWTGPTPGKPRSLEELARVFPGDGLLVALPMAYLQAVAEDLRLAAKAADPNRLAVISAGSGELVGLEPWQVLADARLQSKVGGARVSLNARLARLALDEMGDQFSGQRLRHRFRELMAEQPQAKAPSRLPATDDEVRVFICAALTHSQRLGASSLLQCYRRSGRACGHCRFTALYHQMEGQADGS